MSIFNLGFSYDQSISRHLHVINRLTWFTGKVSELQLNVQHTSGLARAACIWGKDISIFACQKVSELCLMQIHSDYDFSLKPAVEHQMKIVYTPILGCWEHSLCYASPWRLQDSLAP